MLFRNPVGEVSRESRLVAWLRCVLTGVAAILVLLASVAATLSLCLWINYSWNVPFGWWYFSFVGCALFPSLLACGLILRRAVRQRWRFGTRALLSAFTLTAIVAALLANRIHFEWRKQSAVWELTQHGGRPSYTSMSSQSGDWILNWLGYDPFRAIDFVEVRGDDALMVLTSYPDAFPHLTDVTFGGTSDRALRSAGKLDALTQLRGATMLSSQVSDGGLADLAAWQALERLCLNGCTQITDAGLAHFENHPNLELLFVISEGRGRLPITDEGLASIGKIPQLKILLLGESSITDAGLRHLQTLRKLETLAIQRVDITDVGLEHLTRLPNLKNLSIRVKNITDAGLAHLAWLPRLKSLSLRDSNVTDAGVAQLSRIETLESLYIDGMNATDVVLENLSQLTRVKELWIRNTDMSPEAIQTLQAALPGCKVRTDVE